MSARRHSRWVSSAVTFGPVGRILATLLMLLPLWWFWNYAGAFAIAGIPIWLVGFLPRGLRDIWRAVPLPESDDDATSPPARTWR